MSYFDSSWSQFGCQVTILTAGSRLPTQAANPFEFILWHDVGDMVEMLESMTPANIITTIDQVAKCRATRARRNISKIYTNSHGPPIIEYWGTKPLSDAGLKLLFETLEPMRLVLIHPQSVSFRHSFSLKSVWFAWIPLMLNAQSISGHQAQRYVTTPPTALFCLYDSVQKPKLKQ